VAGFLSYVELALSYTSSASTIGLHQSFFTEVHQVRFTSKALALILSTLFLSAITHAQTAAPRTEKTRTGASRELHDLLAREWEFRLQDNPTFASALGDRRYNDRWSDRSLASYAQREQQSRRALADLTRIKREPLSPADKLNYDLLRTNWKTTSRVSNTVFTSCPSRSRAAYRPQTNSPNACASRQSKITKIGLRACRLFPR
jgi:uncharacterized protein (DUF885 family)